MKTKNDLLVRIEILEKQVKGEMVARLLAQKQALEASIVVNQYMLRDIDAELKEHGWQTPAAPSTP